MTAQRNISIDMIKIIACICIVFLHCVNPGLSSGNYIQEATYLIGTFGIPLFFISNGYLLAEKKFNGDYVLKKILHLIRFILIWSGSVGLLYGFYKRSFFEGIKVVTGAFTGSSLLFQLWFASALIVVYIIVYTSLIIIGKCRIKEIVHPCTIWLCIGFLCAEFIGNILLWRIANIEIRDVIPAPIRIIDSLGYFFIGAWLEIYTKKSQKNNRGIIAIILIISYVAIVIAAIVTGIEWASSFYSYVFTIIFCITLFLALLTVKEWKHKKLIVTLSSCSLLVWVLHPFVIRLVNNGLNIILPNLTTWPIALPIVVVVSFAFGYALLNVSRGIKAVRYYIKM